MSLNFARVQFFPGRLYPYKVFIFISWKQMRIIDLQIMVWTAWASFIAISLPMVRVWRERGGRHKMIAFFFEIICVVVQLLNCVQLFATSWTAAHQASMSFTVSQSLLKFMSIELVMPSNHLILCRPFSSCPQSFPASGSYQMSQLFASGGQSIGASTSASVLPRNIQG